MINFCTLFDSFYLDKAMALYQSLENNIKEFRIYIVCFDKLSYDIVCSFGWEQATILPVEDIEDEQLLQLKKERSKAEYCWTCTPVIIEYVLEHFSVESCTYIDADLYFFSDPTPLFKEIEGSGADAVIVEHRFKKDKRYKKFVSRAGKYCVEFNYFCQTENSRKILHWWKEKCLEWCFYKIEPERMGDQKYLEKFPVLFEGVHELKHLGAGVAPWNLSQYKLCDDNKENIVLEEKSTGHKFPLIFYHFQNLRYLTNSIVNLKSQTNDKCIKYTIYFPYLKALVANEKLLREKYGFVLERKKKYSNQWLNTFIQKYVVVFKIKSMSDIVNLRHLK